MKSSRPVLAIAPGKRFFGIAVFQGTELTHFSIRRLRNDKSTTFLKKAISALVNQLLYEFHPQMVVVRSQSKYQKLSTTVGSAIKLIEHETNAKRVKLVTVCLEEVRLALGTAKQSSQKSAFRNLANIYPELKQFLNRPNKAQIEYYHNLLAAVSVGVVFLRSRSSLS